MDVFSEVLVLPTRHEFRTAREGARVRRSVWLRLRAEDGTEGWGEAAATPFYGETAETVTAGIASLAVWLGAMADNLTIEEVERAAREQLGYRPAALAAISAALHDIHGKRMGEPVWRSWGLDPALAPLSSFTLGIDTPQGLAEKVEEARGYSILKLKLGTSRDEALLAEVRKHAPDVRLRVDANTGWTLAEAKADLPMLQSYGVELIEQPLPAEDHAGLRELTRVSPIPIIADESCRTSGDVVRLAGCVHGINIKLAKCGSLLEARRMVDLARQHGLQVMLGCMVESTLGIAAAAQLAPLADYLDLDGAALLADDPFTGPGIEADGTVRLNSEPGLGVRRAAS
jgi:L-alanine-DL-glutamate epimerase-like enolase superfamily enzyme